MKKGHQNFLRIKNNFLGKVEKCHWEKGECFIGSSGMDAVDYIGTVLLNNLFHAISAYWVISSSSSSSSSSTSSSSSSLLSSLSSPFPPHHHHRHPHSRRLRHRHHNPRSAIPAEQHFRSDIFVIVIRDLR